MNVSKKVLTGVLCVGLLGSTAQSEANREVKFLGLSTVAAAASVYWLGSPQLSKEERDWEKLVKDVAREIRKSIASRRKNNGSESFFVSKEAYLEAKNEVLTIMIERGSCYRPSFNTIFRVTEKFLLKGKISLEKLKEIESISNEVKSRSSQEDFVAYLKKKKKYADKRKKYHKRENTKKWIVSRLLSCFLIGGYLYYLGQKYPVQRTQVKS